MVAFIRRCGYGREVHSRVRMDSSYTVNTAGGISFTYTDQSRDHRRPDVNNNEQTTMTITHLDVRTRHITSLDSLSARFLGQIIFE